MRNLSRPILHLLFGTLCFLIATPTFGQRQQAAESTRGEHIRHHAVTASTLKLGLLAAIEYDYTFTNYAIPLSVRGGVGYGFSTFTDFGSRRVHLSQAFLHSSIPNEEGNSLMVNIYTVNAGIGMLPGSRSHRFDGAIYFNLNFIDNATASLNKSHSQFTYTIQLGYRYIHAGSGFTFGTGVALQRFLSLYSLNTFTPLSPYLSIGYSF